jgi:threonine synthase
MASAEAVGVPALAARYADRLPLGSGPVVSLGEGSTPLLPAPRLSKRLGVDAWLKCEGANPTGSFKDRGMTVAVTKAVEDGARVLVCASTGNTAASAAAYGARAGLRVVVLHPEGAVARSKLAQAQAYGARVLAVRGSFEDAFAAARSLAERPGYALVNSLNPYRIEGQKTAAFEIAEELGSPPDVLALPFGGGGNTVAYARGFGEWGGGRTRLVAAESTQRRETFASAIRISEPAHGAAVRRVADVVGVTEDELTEAWRRLAGEEGVFCEPASAAGVAALAHADLAPGTTVVCVLTGHGLKDPDAAAALGGESRVVEPDAVLEAAES